MNGDAPRGAVNGRLQRWYRVLSTEESMEIELRQLREMAARYGAQIERARRELVYRCDLCGADFDRPVSRRWSEARPDGFREPFCQAVCPCCGAEEQYFHEIDGDEEDG